jgi:leucyl aminopeptidase
MTEGIKIDFVPFAAPARDVLIVFADQEMRFGAATRKAISAADDLIARAAKADGFAGKNGRVLDIVAPVGLSANRLLVVGLGDVSQLKPRDVVKLGGVAMGRIPSSAKHATVLADHPNGPMSPAEAADFALGMRLRAYTFDRYKTRRHEREEKPSRARITVAVADVAAARRAWAPREAQAQGVALARDLVNEPANVLYPEEFARRARALTKLGVAVEVLEEKAMKKLGMNALLGVGRGSAHGSRLIVLRWNGGKRGAPPFAVIGKGVTFDTGGISIKPAASMEDMKGDMAGAACVLGLMLTLALRKAKVNVVGAIGCVENMPSGDAQRPGDIVRSMSGQTIEIINTDAEGRLVLADVLHYVKQRFKPSVMVDLATLTGAIVVALGHEHAGLFANDDRIAEQLIQAGEATGERVWRMPLAPEYDKLIDSKVADVKNTGGRQAGAITAAQFLQRFVDNAPWAHLDIAGTAMASPQTDINKSWGSGWGVRLLDHLLAQHYER